MASFSPEIMARLASSKASMTLCILCLYGQLKVWISKMTMNCKVQIMYIADTSKANREAKIDIRYTKYNPEKNRYFSLNIPWKLSNRGSSLNRGNNLDMILTRKKLSIFSLKIHLLASG